jgi:NTE family protein
MTKIKYLSFEGGGVKGLAFVGILKYFEEKGISQSDLIAVSGSSIGSIMALCVVLKLTSIEIKSLFDKYNFYNFLSFTKILSSIPNLFYKYGFLSTNELDKIINDIFNLKNIPTDISFTDLYNLTNINLIVTISNLNTNKTIFCSHNDTPSKDVKSTIITSASFPIIFTPTVIKDETSNQYTYYTDGGLFANIPFNYFDDIYDETDTHLYAYGCIFEENTRNINNLFDYIESLISGLLDNSTDKYYDTQGKIDSRVISISLPSDISTFSVLTEEQKNILIDCGYKSALSYFGSNI